MDGDSARGPRVARVIGTVFWALVLGAILDVAVNGIRTRPGGFSLSFETLEEAVSFTNSDVFGPTWPGAQTSVVEQGSGDVVVERRWMGMLEASGPLERGSGCLVADGRSGAKTVATCWTSHYRRSYGPGETAQIVVVGQAALVLGYAAMRLYARVVSPLARRTGQPIWKLSLAWVWCGWEILVYWSALGAVVTALSGVEDDAIALAVVCVLFASFGAVFTYLRLRVLGLRLFSLPAEPEQKVQS